VVRINRAAAEHKRPAYLALKPKGLLQVLEDGDLVLFETGAIPVHLADRTGRLGPEAPGTAEPQARAALLKWLFYLSNTVHADLRAAFYPARYVADEAAIPALRAGLAARMRWAQLYPSGAALITWDEIPPRLQSLPRFVENRPAVRKALDDEYIAGRPLTSPAPPNISPSEATA
jgi:glutathione S-transferase